MYLLTEWEGQTEKYLARGPYLLTESQIFSLPARPYSVNKHFIICPLTVESLHPGLDLNRTRLHKIRGLRARNNREFTKPRRQRQQERHQTKELMNRTMAVHERFESLFISLPSSAKQQREMTKFCVVWRT